MIIVLLRLQRPRLESNIVLSAFAALSNWNAMRAYGTAIDLRQQRRADRLSV
jgi:hypothetical protein